MNKIVLVILGALVILGVFVLVLAAALLPSYINTTVVTTSSPVKSSENITNKWGQSITYTDYKFKNRLVVNSVNPYIYPGETKLVQRTIDAYTLVRIIDSGVSGDGGSEQWLYVEFPVYDTPMDNHGWIKEKDTVELTKDNREKVRSRVSVKNGEDIYSVTSISEIPKATPKKAVNISGKIEEEKNGYVRLSVAGGEEFWVEKKDIVYPEVK